MNKSPAFQFYAQDFLTGVMYLTNEEKGIYITMLAKQWTDGKIPKKRLGFLVGLEWGKFSEELREKFKDCGDYLVNTRLEEERERKKNFLKKQQKNGKKGGRPPKQNDEIKNPNESQKKPLEHEHEIEVEKEVEKEHEVELKKPENQFLIDLEILKKEIKTEFTWKETLIRNLKEVDPVFSLEKLENSLEQFFKVIENDGEEEKTIKDFKKHFSRWLNIEIKKTKTNEQGTIKTGQYSQDYIRKKAEILTGVKSS